VPAVEDTMVAPYETEMYRQDAKNNFLTPKQREDLLKSYLPTPPQLAKTPRRQMARPLWQLLRNQLHLLVFTIIHIIFSVYIRIRHTYHVLVDRMFAILYYHHRAPELIRRDVKELDRIPDHLSVILELRDNEAGTAGLEKLLDEVAELSAWCTCVGIPMLSVYEKTGTCLSHRDEDTQTSLLIKDRSIESIHSQNPPSSLVQITCLPWPKDTILSGQRTSCTSLLDWWQPTGL